MHLNRSADFGRVVSSPFRAVRPPPIGW